MMLHMARIPGVGLAKGLSVTLRHMLRRSVTQQYPEVRPDLPARSRGVIALVEENCTSCMLCARECPDWCIYIDSHKETLPAPEGGRPRQRNVLDRFAIDFSLCMYCGICIEVCPFDALFWSPEFEYAEGDIRNMLHEKDRLTAWAQTVPPPPAHEVGAEPPKELIAAPRRPATRPGRLATSSSDTPGRPAAISSDASGRPTSTRPTPAGTTPSPETGPTPTTDSAAAGDIGSAPTSGSVGSPEPGSDAASASGSGAVIRPGSTAPTSPSADASSEVGSQDSVSEESTSTDVSSSERVLEDRESGGGTPPDAATAGESQAEASSTGQIADEELSTDSGAPPAKPSREEQTSSEAPRRRRMVDPRSIRPPGGLKRESPQEPEEE